MDVTGVHVPVGGIFNIAAAGHQHKTVSSGQKQQRVSEHCVQGVQVARFVVYGVGEGWDRHNGIAERGKLLVSWQIHKDRLLEF